VCSTYDLTTLRQDDETIDSQLFLFGLLALCISQQHEVQCVVRCFQLCLFASRREIVAIKKDITFLAADATLQLTSQLLFDSSKAAALFGRVAVVMVFLQARKSRCEKEALLVRHCCCGVCLFARAAAAIGDLVQETKVRHVEILELLVSRMGRKGKPAAALRRDYCEQSMMKAWNKTMIVDRIVVRSLFWS